MSHPAEPAAGVPLFCPAGTNPFKPGTKYEWRSCSGDCVWVTNLDRIDEIIKEGITNIRRILSCLKFLMQGYQSRVFLIKSQSCKCWQSRSLENWRSQRHSNECLESNDMRLNYDVALWRSICVQKRVTILSRGPPNLSNFLIRQTKNYWTIKISHLHFAVNDHRAVQNNCTEWICIYWKQHWL